MKGVVDNALRALLEVPVAASDDGDRSEILVWMLLDGHRLNVDYDAKTVELT